MSIEVFESLAVMINPYKTPSPERDRGNGLETRPGIEPVGRGNVIPKLPSLSRILTIHGGEEVSPNKNLCSQLEKNY
jgi:hypothetical protein